MLLRGEIPPSAGFENKADNIKITPINKLTKTNSSYALSTSLAFGGCNSVLVIKRNN
jgi:3-oxoacyl-(acyl-carrier-protein) synthase